MSNPRIHASIRQVAVPCLIVTLTVGCGWGWSGRSLLAAEPSAARGWEVLRTHRFLPPDLDDAVFDELWTVWPEPERSEAAAADSETRRRLTMSYYGLIPATDPGPNEHPVLGYVRDERGGWVMNCLTCHGGQVAGRVIPGLPNSHLALQTLTEDVRLIKLRLKKPLSHLDVGTLTMPLSMTNGTTNAVVFGILLGAFRLPDMSVDLRQPVPAVTHHDVDAPPFWNVKYKSSLYIDGFAPKTHRPLMQFMLLPSNTREIVQGWETDFADILAWIEAVEAPRYPWPIDDALATGGRRVFEEHCARCHGTYGPDGKYEQRTIPWDEVRTDRVRLDALTVEHRAWMREGWMSRYGADPVVVDPVGYVPPPLHGVWASAPYFHNGSVPTLWHVLHPDQRPHVWKRTETGYDQARVGLEVTTFDELPEDVEHPAHRRRYFDTRLTGKSAEGHDFPSRLTADEKAALLEYLKGL